MQILKRWYNTPIGSGAMRTTGALVCCLGVLDSEFWLLTTEFYLDHYHELPTQNPEESPVRTVCYQ